MPTSLNLIINGRYQILSQIGSGGMAEVFLAKDKILERQIAVKILKTDLSRNREFRQQFILEAKAAANLAHPNIVTVFDFGFHESEPFIVMEYIPGNDLKTLLQQKRAFTIQDTIDLMIQACAGLGYAHRAGLVHCDVKPQNLMVTTDLKLKVTDFGIARALATINPNEKVDIVWGSPLYFSPEQASGMSPSPSSDVYSLGIVMYEMLTGRLPFSASSADELSRMHRETLPPPPSTFNPKVSADIDQIVQKIISKEPSARYRTADQLGRVLGMVYLQMTPNGMISVSYLNKVIPQPIPNNLPTSLKPNQIDWGTLGIGMTALLFAGGLIPFWLYIYLFLIAPAH